MTNKQKNTGNHHIKATVTEILHDGSENMPFKAMVQMSENHYLMLTSKTPLPVNVGDDIRAEGLLIKADKYQLPDHFYILEPQSPAKRLKDISQNGAEIRNFASPETKRRNRPASTAIKHGLEGNIATEIIHDNCSLIRHNNAENPIIEWAASLFDGLNNDRLTMIIDSHNVGADVLTNSPSQIHDRQWVSETSFQHKQKSPAAISKYLGEENVKSIAQSPASYITWNNSSHLQNEKQISLIIPFHPHQNAATLTAGLSCNFINGRDAAIAHNLPIEQRQAFAAVHELAHSVQDLYIEGSTESKNNMSPAKAGAQTLFQEIYADSFAFLAILQRYNDADFLHNIAGLRHAGLLGAGFDHATGFAMDALLEKAKKWQENGKLKEMTTAKMLDIAADHANNYKLNIDDYTALRDASFNLHNGFEKEGTAYNKKDIEKMKSRTADIENKAAQEYYQTALDRVNGLAFDKEDLQNTANHNKAIEIYKNDLAEMVKNAGDDLMLSEGIIKSSEKRFPIAYDNNKFAESCKNVIESQKANLPTPKAPANHKLPPWRIIQTNNKASKRAEFFKAKPAKRLEIYRDLLRKEAAIIENITDAKPLSPEEIYQLGHIGKAQHDAAFALRADDEIWQKVKKISNNNLQSQITETANRFFKPHSYNRGDAYYIKARKAKIKELLNSLPKPTKKPKSSPKP